MVDADLRQQVVGSGNNQFANITGSQVNAGNTYVDYSTEINYEAAHTDPVDQIERERANRTPFAVDVAAMRERTVHVAQRITLDRSLAVAHVESAGATAGLLGVAEDHLVGAGYTGPRRCWVGCDTNSALDGMTKLIARRAPGGTDRIAMIVHAPDGDANPSIRSYRDLHMQACVSAGFTAGPTVMVGTSWRVDLDDADILRLLANGPARVEPPTLDQDLDRAIRDGQLADRVADGSANALAALAAIARAGQISTGRYDELVAVLLARTSASVQRAWTVLRDGAATVADRWSPERDFIALVMRGQRGPVVPLRDMAAEVLSEDALWDEIRRLAPTTPVLQELLATPASSVLGLDVFNQQNPDIERRA